MGTRFYLPIFLICSVLVNFGHAQNLIKNASFEAYDNCPMNTTSFEHLVKEVTLPSSSSADYFNACSAGDFGVPKNLRGQERAADGQAYAGLYFYALNDYREYLQFETLNTLRKKYPYKLSFKVSLAETSTMAVKNMSVMLVSRKVRMPNSATITPSRLDLLEIFDFQEVKLTADNSLGQKEGWVTLSAEFTAKGFENHIVIGNFKDNVDTKVIKTDGTIENSDFAYYFVDDFSLEALPRLDYEKDKIYVLERDPFKPKGYKLDKSAIESINKIYSYLRENAEVQLKITGHAADRNTPEYNQFISSLRARAVALYLKELGIDESRLVWEGVGDTRPLRNGKVNQDKGSNSRVEFVMTEVKKN